MPFRDIDDKWHFLFFKIVNPTFGKPTLDLFLDSFENKQTLSIQLKGFDFEAEYYITLGNSTELLLRHLKETKDFASMTFDEESKT